MEYKIFDTVAGYNPLKMLINHALTGKMCDGDIAGKINPISMRPSYNVSCLCAPGTIASIDGCDKLKESEGIIDFILTHYPGDTITEEMRGLLTQITVRVLGYVDNKEQLCEAMQNIEAKIQIVSTEGENLLLSGIQSVDIEGMVI